MPAKTPGQRDIREGRELMQGAATGAGAWNTEAQNISSGAQNYAQNNPWSSTALPYMQNILGGGISQNPFMQTIQNVTSGLNPQNQLEWLNTYAGNPSTTPAQRGSSPAGRGGARVTSTRGSSSSVARPRPGSGGNVPDTVGGQNTFFAQQMRDLFDPAHLDPANDPTLQPVIDAMQREAGEDYLRNIAGLQDQMAGAGRYGSGLYQAMIGQQTEEQQEAVSQAIAQAMMGAYQAQQGRRMEGLGMTNTRDIAAMQDLTSRYGIDQQRAAASASIAAQERQAAESRRLQAMGMNLDAQLGLLGLAGNMGSVLQGGQTAAMQTGLGYGQLGMSGYDTGINAGQLGLGALGLQSNIGQGIMQGGFEANAQAQQEHYANLQGQQSALNDYLNMLIGIGGMGGYGEQTNPGQYIPSANPWAGALSGGVGGYLTAYGTLNR